MGNIQYAPPFVLVNPVFGGRAIDGTVYRNTSGKLMMVFVRVLHQVTVAGVQHAYCYAFTDSADPPTTNMGGSGIYNGTNPVMNLMTTMVFMVSPGHYYKVTSTVSVNGTNTLLMWNEVT